MKKLFFVLILSIIFVSGCTITKISDKSTSDILETILYVSNNLSNTNMDGYSLYLPSGIKIKDKKDFNLQLEDKNNSYYLYIDTIAYHYHVKNKYQENNHFYSKKIEHDGKEGYIDVLEKDSKYFVVIMYNYAKMETYVPKKDFNSALISMCSILATIKYNDKVINNYVGDKKVVFQEEHFDIFNSDIESDNFLKYEEEYGTYKDTIDISKDNDVIDLDETIE